MLPNYPLAALVLWWGWGPPGGLPHVPMLAVCVALGMLAHIADDVCAHGRDPRQPGRDPRLLTVDGQRHRMTTADPGRCRPGTSTRESGCVTLP